MPSTEVRCGCGGEALGGGGRGRGGKVEDVRTGGRDRTGAGAQPVARGGGWGRASGEGGGGPGSHVSDRATGCPVDSSSRVSPGSGACRARWRRRPHRVSTSALADALLPIAPPSARLDSCPLSRSRWRRDVVVGHGGRISPSSSFPSRPLPPPLLTRPPRVVAWKISARGYGERFDRSRHTQVRSGGHGGGGVAGVSYVARCARVGS